VANQGNQRIQIWSNESVNPTKTINVGGPNLFSLFVTNNEDFYFYYSLNSNHRIDKVTMNTSISVNVMFIENECRGLFVDISNNLYVSIYGTHKVILKSLNISTNTSTIGAGTGSSGSTSNQLKNPSGIFVDINFDLYVADSQNNRIQLLNSTSYIQ